jgi:hypothetical protein
MADQGIIFTAKVDDSQLQRKIAEVARASGKTVADEQRVVMKGIVRDVLTYTPPASQRAQGLDARRSGEASIVRDMKKLFIPVTLKGKRTEQWPNPHELHHRAFASGQIEAPLVKYHVDTAKLTSLKNVLRPHVGLLASGWARAAQTLGVSVPAWIARWAGAGRGTDLQVITSGTQIVLKVTNRMPNTAAAIAAQTQRLINFAKKAALGRLVRQLPYLIKRQMRS